MSAPGEESGEREPLMWELNPAQWDFVHTAARFSFYVGGIGAGKTFAGAARAILRMIEDPGSLGLIGAPTYPMLRDASQRTFFALLPRPLIRRYLRAEERLLLRNGSEVLFRSLDAPDRARGVNLAWFWLDEAPLCGHYAWQVLKGRLRQAGHPTAAWATGTPRGQDGFARDFESHPGAGSCALPRLHLGQRAPPAARTTSRTWAIAAPSPGRRSRGYSSPSRGWSTPSTPRPARTSAIRRSAPRRRSGLGAGDWRRGLGLYAPDRRAGLRPGRRRARLAARRVLPAPRQPGGDGAARAGGADPPLGRGGVVLRPRRAGAYRRADRRAGPRRA